MVTMSARIVGGGADYSDTAKILADALFGDPEFELNAAKARSQMRTEEFERRRLQAAADYDRARSATERYGLETSTAAGNAVGEDFAARLPVPVEPIESASDELPPMPVPIEDMTGPTMEEEGLISSGPPLPTYDEEMADYNRRVAAEKAKARAVYAGGGNAAQRAEGANKLEGGFTAMNETDPDKIRKAMLLLGINPTDSTVLGEEDLAGTKSKVAVEMAKEKAKVDFAGKAGPVLTGDAAAAEGLDPKGRWQKKSDGTYDLLEEPQRSAGPVITGPEAEAVGLDPKGKWQSQPDGSFSLLGTPERWLPMTPEQKKQYNVSEGVAASIEQSTGKIYTGAQPAAPTPVPPDMGAKIGLIDDFLGNFDSIIEVAKAGDLTGPVDYAKSVLLGRGKGGQAWREIRTGTEGIVRILTGAGMLESEARDRAVQYEPYPTDDAQTLVNKLTGLRETVLALRRGATAGHKAPAEPASGGEVARPQTDEDFAKLAPATHYIDPEDGKEYIK